MIFSIGSSDRFFIYIYIYIFFFFLEWKPGDSGLTPAMLTRNRSRSLRAEQPGAPPSDQAPANDDGEDIRPGNGSRARSSRLSSSSDEVNPPSSLAPSAGTGVPIVPSNPPPEGGVTHASGNSIDAVIEAVISSGLAQSPSSGFSSVGSPSGDDSSTLPSSPPPVATEVDDVSVMSSDDSVSNDPVSIDHSTPIRSHSVVRNSRSSRRAERTANQRAAVERARALLRSAQRSASRVSRFF